MLVQSVYVTLSLDLTEELFSIHFTDILEP